MHHNTVSGTAHTVVQARDVHGGVHLHAPPAQVLPPRQLPPLRPFVNRSAEHRALDQAWQERSGPLWVAVQGPPGVGKTACCATWAHRHADRWPDGALYADLAHSDPDTVLAGWVSALGVHRAPGRPDELRALWRTLTHHRRVLVMADNVTTADAAVHLLPAGPGCAGVAIGHTGVTDLVAHGAHHLSFGPLPPAEIRHLIAQLVPHQPSDAVLDAAATASHGSPLVAVLTASHLARHRSATPAQLAARQEPTPVHDRVADLLAGLDHHSALAARLLAAHPGPHVTPDLAGAILHTTPQAAQTTLARLVDAGLLTDLGRNRYTVHQLVAAAVQGHLDQTERDRTIGAIAHFYRLRTAAVGRTLNAWRWVIDETGLELATAAQRDSGPWFTDRSAAIAWTDGELDNLMAIARHCADSDHRGIAWHIADHLGTYFTLRKPWAVMQQLFPLALTAARAGGNPCAAALMYQRIARTSTEPGRARHHAERALELYRQAAHHEGVASAHESLGTSYLISGRRGDLHQAVRLFDESERLHLALGRVRGAAIQRRKGAEARIRLGRHSEALTRLDHARQTLLELTEPDRYQAVRCRQAAVKSHLALGELSRAEQVALAAVDESRSAGAVHEQAALHETLAEVQQARGDHAQEITHLARAVELFDAMGHPDGNRVRTRLATLRSTHEPSPVALGRRSDDPPTRMAADGL